MKAMNIVRYIIIGFLGIVLLFWSTGSFSKMGLSLISDTILGVFVFILLVINCYAGALALKGNAHKELIDKITSFTILSLVMLPALFFVLKMTLEGESLIEFYFIEKE